MADAFAARPDGDLGTRLMAALAAGLEAGGEEGPVHSAGLLVVSDMPWPLTDLRVDRSIAHKPGLAAEFIEPEAQHIADPGRLGSLRAHVGINRGWQDAARPRQAPG